ncbi:UDP-N-acetylmuramoyl-L-alanyl-D-glutamate--2,6-diaminopimelate ligase [Bacillus ectoiniformans]|uniref:UDP-N-acetylmuramoyl-L-alanyl-D-glutamate--2, 6-diaminopimelate ligase n=1 Tax=Bacillus ectoiniformans TaxID=1494429 RepID=UPI00195A2C3B|nr:UDP-N-acetylmuramoyl-L-alanyl-D-glutamate--2,6-diaminopimelate ligase [Bacillus ectoiniformans]MBM7649483.1 UDP-N-acetylmuramoyl-L-alanyl-D-glutamate--2,6-diaminopimelate ligase [Bacillus ectoiniformans]
MRISFSLIPQFSVVHLFGPARQEVTSIAYNSHQVQNGSVFFCIEGENTDGHLYIEQAIQQGAMTIVGSQADILQSFSQKHPARTFLHVKNTKEALAYFSIYFYENAKDHLVKVGVTGTNGKTTVATFVSSLFNLLDIDCGLLGTTGIWTKEGKLEFEKSTPTTPMAPNIHQIFHKLVASNHKAAAMEVSSISLDQKRVEGIRFDVAIHTNVSEEHMEYHRTMDHYTQSKLQLFKQAKTSVVNVDDQEMASRILAIADHPVITYSRRVESGADLVWGNCEHHEEGMAFDLTWQDVTERIEVPLYGEYNIGNLTAAIGAALLIGVEMEDILAVLPQMPQVEGRFQTIQTAGRKVILDYAHTPVALKSVLDEVKKIPHSRLIAMIAGIGIRDFGKMPKMAKAADGEADVLIVTVDHPGYHDPEEIVNQVMTGFAVPHNQPIYQTTSRSEGVRRALEKSGEGDIVLLTSGCINGAQIVKGKSIPHSDEKIIKEYFQSEIDSRNVYQHAEEQQGDSHVWF